MSLKIVHINPRADIKVIDREASKQMIQKFLRRDQKRIAKKYNLPSPTEKPSRNIS